jgi:5-(carboxyamino)imidazole ribonucleotide mutase
MANDDIGPALWPAFFFENGGGEILSMAKTSGQAAREAGKKPLVGILMGSTSDWGIMEHATKTLADLGIPFETRVISAHRAPDLLFEYASTAEQRGLEIIIAGAGGAAHLPGVTAAKTVLPVLGVPIESVLKGLDSLLSMVQMPGGIPVGTLAIGKAGAINAALLSAAMLGNKYPEIRERLKKFREAQTAKVAATPDPSSAVPSK